MPANISYLGELFSLLTAFAWASAVILFKKSGETVHPIALNIFKNLLAFVLFIPTMLILGESVFYSAPSYDYIILLISGAIGLGIGDTLFFISLNMLGASLIAIVDCLYSPLVIVLSLIWLNESLSLLQMIGVLFIISAVFEATYQKSSDKLSRHNLIWGMIWGIVSITAMSVSIVMAKPVLERSPLIWVTEVRFIGGLAALFGALLFYKSRRTIVSSLKISRGRRYTILGSFFGAYLSMILWLAGMKLAQASVASALNQTSNVLIFVLAAIFLKEQINLKRTVAIILAVIGVFLVTFG